MALDLTKPVTTDNYATVVLPVLQGNTRALASFLEGEAVTGVVDGVKRYNASTRLFERYSTAAPGGPAWVEMTLDYMKLSGGTVSGAAAFNGNVVLGDSAARTLTIRPNNVTWSNNPTHSGNHTFSGNVGVGGTFSVSSGTSSLNGNVNLGGAAANTLTVRSAGISWLNSPTHSGNHTFSGEVNFSGLATFQNLNINGNTRIGNQAADTLTIFCNAVSWQNAVSHTGNQNFQSTVTFSGPVTFSTAPTFGVGLVATLFSASGGVAADEPKFRFNSDQDTGMAWGGANVLWLVAGGIPQLGVTPSNVTVNGNLLIGGTAYNNAGAPISAYYTGADQDLSNYPVGSILLVRRTAGTFARNAVVPVFAMGGSNNRYFRTDNGGSDIQLSGQWRSRGSDGSDDRILVQRVS